MLDVTDYNLLLLNEPQKMSYLNFKQIEQEYSFFYDETNNIRKFYIKSNKFNCPSDNNFVLGGIFYNTYKNNIDFEKFFSSLSLQKTTNEVKLKHICTGDFPCMLKSKRLTSILNWLLDHNIYIHFTNVDIFYWGIVDIVDSIIEEIGYAYNRELKDILYRSIRNDKKTFISLCDKYCYPNIKPGELINYKNEMYEFLLKNRVAVPSHLLYLFDYIIYRFMYTKYFDFIMDEEDHILIDSFGPFYTGMLKKFEKAKHILDEEETIREDIIPLTNDYLKSIDFKFVDSKFMREIQLSDIISGFLGKYFTFIKNTSCRDLEQIKVNLSEIQKYNLRLFLDIINISKQLTPLSTTPICSLHDFEKSYLFLHNS